MASDIAKNSKMARPNVYDILNKLVKNGLASYIIKNNKRYFKPSDPQTLLENIKEKEHEFSSALPELKKMYAPLKEKPKIEVYEGSEGIRTVLNDVINTKKELLVWGASARIAHYLPVFTEKYVEERKRKKIKARQIYAEGTEVLKSPLSQFKKVGKEYAGPTTIAIYGDKVAIWIWGEVPMVVRIENKDVAKTYKDQFELSWKEIK